MGNFCRIRTKFHKTNHIIDDDTLDTKFETARLTKSNCGIINKLNDPSTAKTSCLYKNIVHAMDERHGNIKLIDLRQLRESLFQKLQKILEKNIYVNVIPLIK